MKWFRPVARTSSKLHLTTEYFSGRHEAYAPGRLIGRHARIGLSAEAETASVAPAVTLRGRGCVLNRPGVGAFGVSRELAHFETVLRV